MRKLIKCQGCGQKFWLDRDNPVFPKHKLRTVPCPMSGQKLEEK